MKFNRLLTLITALAIGPFAFAHDYKVGDLQVEHAVARPSFPGQTSGGAYLSIENKGKDADRLVSASTPAAKSAQIHTMSMEGNVMKMREVDGIELKPSSKTVMQPGKGYHIMLIGLKHPLKVGDHFPLTLNFEKAGKLNLTVSVEKISSEMQMNNSDSASHPHK